MNREKIWLTILLFLAAFLGEVFLGWPITLIFLSFLAFYWEEEIFWLAFAVGLWRDLLSWQHLGTSSMIFIIWCFLIIIVKRRFLGLGQHRLSLPK
jgi:hypothetical protein